MDYILKNSLIAQLVLTVKMMKLTILRLKRFTLYDIV